MKFTVTKKFTKEQISHLLCCAFEGGSNYWATSPWNNAKEVGAEYCFEAPLNANGFFMIKDMEENGNEYKITAEEIQTGLNVFASEYTRHYNNFTTDNFDAETGDVFLQCCVFGKVIYG